MPTSPDRTIRRVTFYFDPACPWTWRTSRWLVDAAASRDVPVEYAAFELTAGKSLDDVPTDRRAVAAASRSFLRAVTVARQRGRHDLIRDWYTAFGVARWDESVEPGVDLVRRTLTDVGGSDLLDTLDDTSVDEAMAASRREAIEWAGDDAGSPITVWDIDGQRRGFFGPVVAPTPTDSAADVMWDVVVQAATVPEFFELKARRTTTPN